MAYSDAANSGLPSNSKGQASLEDYCVQISTKAKLLLRDTAKFTREQVEDLITELNNFFSYISEGESLEIRKQAIDINNLRRNIIKARNDCLVALRTFDQEDLFQVNQENQQNTQQKIHNAYSARLHYLCECAFTLETLVILSTLVEARTQAESPVDPPSLAVTDTVSITKRNLESSKSVDCSKILNSYGLSKIMADLLNDEHIQILCEHFNFQYETISTLTDKELKCIRLIKHIKLEDNGENFIEYLFERWPGIVKALNQIN